MTDLTQALAELRRVTPPNSPWEAGDIGVGSSPVDYHIATILNAAASGDLIPKADADLAVALMVEKAASTGYRICAETRHVTLGRQVEDTIRTLVPASAWADLKALRADRDRLDAVTNTLSEMWEGEQTARHSAEAELVALRAQVERLTVKPLLFSELVDGGCTGRPHPFQYFITQNHNGRFLCHWDETWHDTLPEAQANAQKHYQIAALTEGAAP